MAGDELVIIACVIMTSRLDCHKIPRDDQQRRVLETIMLLEGALVLKASLYQPAELL